MVALNFSKKLNRELKYYCKNQIWNFLDSSDIIGIVLDNGKTVYINIVSRSFDTRGTILIFKNLKALGTCISLFPPNPENGFEYAYSFAQQDCLCLSLYWDMNGDNKTPYIEANIIKPGFTINHVDDPNDLELIYKVLVELKKLTGIVKADDKSLRRNRVYPAINGRGLLNIYEFKNNKANVVRRIAMDFKKEPEPKVIYNNDLLVSEFKRLPHFGKWILEILYLPESAEYDDKTETYKLHNSLYLLDPEYGYEEFIHLESDSREEPDKFINEVARELLYIDILPAEVLVRDERSFNVLEDFLSKIGVELKKEQQIEELQELESRIFSADEAPNEPFGNETLSFDDFIELEKEYGFIPDNGDNPYLRRIEKKLKEYKEELEKNE